LLLLYANEYEVKHVHYMPARCIGLGACKLGYHEWDIKKADSVILFGCAGWIPGKGVKLDRLYEWSHLGPLVDMESEIVSDLCKKHGVEFRSIRYIIDYDRGKVMPTGINHFWRKYQHRRMQRKFNKWLS